MSQQRVAEFLREILVFLSERQEAHRDEILGHLEQTFRPTGEELATEGRGRQSWVNRVTFASTNLVHGTGWLTKDGYGTWSITPAGREALDRYPDPLEFRRVASATYRASLKSRQSPQRRAWLVRGSSVTGVNVVPGWLAEGYVSVAGSQLPPIEPGVDPVELTLLVDDAYAHLRHHELRAKIDEIVGFVTKISPGDVVLTTSEGQVFVGDVTGDWSYQASDDNRTNLRRPVEWRNPDAPIDFADLPAPLPARLQTGSTVLDLTADLAVIDEMLDVGAGQADPEAAPPLPRHEHLPEPSAGLAKALFVDLAWLSEVRDLLDERRQVIFYGPPGTGKTYLARKLAADLVGPEQVKLVQFHPAYTYEDFFEGYRPVPAGTGTNGAGMIAFELRAGPFRQLVDRAREHPDQAFVLIVDEINRANLAKVFGELYFLLEYRDEAVDLLYSADDEGFTLPKNLYVIGTMNTADRSIALVDAAMRRRFAFVALNPDEEPTRSLLREWSEHHGLGPMAADLLEQLNGVIEDPDFRIGPAYFMKSTAPDAHSPERLERIWRTSIIPLLQEHHYGEWDTVGRRYQLAALLRVSPVEESPAGESSRPDESSAGESSPPGSIDPA